MNRPENVACENCVYYSSPCCHLGPPQVIPRVDNSGDCLTTEAQTAWPMVQANAFCGEFADSWDDPDEDGDITETIPGTFPAFPPAP